MAEGRARVNREFRDRLTERVHANLLEAGKLAQQLTKSSRSHEILSQSTKHFVSQEASLMNTTEKVQHMHQLTDQMKLQQRDIQQCLQGVEFIKKQLDYVWVEVPRM
ncbi:uncharacterized protein LOC110253091 [Exaiptasia diaphana]|uniref:BLOC-1-related complex subunit 7 n=1 Tax=Exaiptasia diaphana TaxID=2652724 RepID=A0A913Y6S4_EXADI|nr:uncharacterized protein LOC110253091 [Exaiptasia diaphana]KXJ22057.1 UPF0693 protein C10orf32-like [Exaiptasia diaphana]